jgi:hypothetical protein
VIRADSATVIERPRLAVFDFVATGFFSNYPRWAPEVTQLTALSAGPLRVGSLGRQVRLDYGRRTEATFRVTRLVPGEEVAFEGLTTPFTIAYRFAAFGEHTRVALRFELTRIELFMRPFERVIRRAVDESVVKTMRTLKTVAEREIALGPLAAATPAMPSAPSPAASGAAANDAAAGPAPRLDPDPGLSRA